MLLSIHVQIFEFSQEMIVIGEVCGEESRGDVEFDEAQVTALSGSRQGGTPAYSEYQDIRSKLDRSVQLHPTTANHIRERLRSSSNQATGQFGYSLLQRSPNFQVKFLSSRYT